ncbi:uncharacterized protein [Drosophila takahashii]|uniref:uncharacterized protein n=1 Tax=Drosophila takahashii TaxID=29030 RepID=UPI003898FC8B
MGKTMGYFCEETVNLANGTMTIGIGYPKFECNSGYELLERQLPLESCKQGLLRGEKFFCAKKGCKEIPQPKIGKIVNTDGLKAVLKCDEGFVLYGNNVTFCNGVEWSTQLGSCQKTNQSVQYSCDFEGEDQCGWKSHGGGAWRKNSAANDFHSNKTGPQRDHTFDSDTEGHFILMETGRSNLFEPEHFVSPIYPKDITLGNKSCFLFHTFMFGTGVKNLVVSVKPKSMDVKQMWDDFQAMYTKLTVYGEQGSHWQYYSIPIDEMEEDFQVVFTPSDPESRSGDIAIDDVKLTRGKCIAEKPKASPLPTPAEPTTSTPTTKSIITTSKKDNCYDSINLSNGNVTLENGRPKYKCDSEYTLQGSLNDDCLKGLIRGERLFCGKHGCANSTNPPNGIVFNDGFKAVVKCDEGFVLYGNKVAYCNGNEWNTELGSCKKAHKKLEYSCDFEGEDQCEDQCRE